MGQKKKRKKEFCRDSNDFGFICAGVSEAEGYKRNTWYKQNCLFTDLLPWELQQKNCSLADSFWRPMVRNQLCAVPNHHSAQRAMSFMQKGQKFLWTLPERMDSHPVPDHLTCSCSLTAELTLVEAAALASTLSGTGVNLSTNTTSLHQPTKTPPFWFYNHQLCWYMVHTLNRSA